MHIKLLKVSDPKGFRIKVFVTKNNKTVTIKSDVIEVVKKDKPLFSNNGKICMNVELKNYKEAITKLTKYLEDLFLKELNDNDISHSSDATKTKSVGNIEQRSGKNVAGIKREGCSSSVPDSARREKSTEDSGRK